MAISTTNQPQLPNLTVVIVNGKYSYLWPYTTKIVNGRMVRTKGPASVGSIQGGGQTGLVVWKKEFLDEHPELKAYDVYRKETRRGTLTTMAEYQFSFVPKTNSNNFVPTSKKELFQAGATWFLDQILANTTLVKALNRTFYKDQTSSKLISLVYFVLLSRSLDFNNYINCVGSVRLPYPGALTERDINLFLKELSDVQLANFFEELQEVSSYDKEQASYYVIEHGYPNNVINSLVDGKLSLSCSNSTLHNAINKEINQVNWRTQKSKHKLNSLAHYLDDRAFTMVNAQNGLPIFARTYNSKEFALDEVLNFCQDHVFIQINKRNFSKGSNQLTQEYLQAVTGGFDDIKPSNTPDLMSYIGSNSENGQIFAINKFSDSDLQHFKLLNKDFIQEPSSLSDHDNDVEPDLNDQDQSSFNYHAHGQSSFHSNFKSKLSTLTKAQDNDATSQGQSALASRLRGPLSKRLKSNSSASTTRFSSNAAFSAPIVNSEDTELKSPQALRHKKESENLNKVPEPSSTQETSTKILNVSENEAKLILLTEVKDHLISRLSSLCQDRQSFILKLSSLNMPLMHLIDDFIKLLVTQAHYDPNDQCFNLSTNINFAYRDLSSSTVIKSPSGKLISLPKKRLQTLFVHIKLDLKALYAQLKQFEKELMQKEFGDNSYDEDELINNERKEFGFWDLSQCLKFSTKSAEQGINDKLFEQISNIKASLEEEGTLTRRDITAIKSLAGKLFMLNHNALSIMVSNSVHSLDKAHHAHELLIAHESFYDYMSWDIFKLERANFDPFTYKMKPEVAQLLRAKNFILFLTSSVYNLMQCAIFNKDQKYGTTKIRNSLGFSTPDEYLQALNSIVAERKKEGLLYGTIGTRETSLFDYLDSTIPSQEQFNHISSDGQVALRNYELKSDWARYL